jgi:citrate synthase
LKSSKKTETQVVKHESNIQPTRGLEVVKMEQIPETANKGLENIVACTSEISTIHDVTLLFRGYTIEDLSQKCGFEEVTYLLWNGELPNPSQLKEFKSSLSKGLDLPKELIPMLKQIAEKKSHPMAKLRTAVSAYGLLDPKADDISPEAVREKATKLTAAIGPIVCALSRLGRGLDLVAPQYDKTLAWNFLNMLRGKAPSAEEEKLFDTALVLHADHELNASTFTARVVASTTSDYYSNITGAICSLKGPLHGGANEAVMVMLEQIGGYDKVDAFIDDAITHKKKVMGIGHRVYKNGDPRARILKELSFETCKKSGMQDKHKMLTRIQERMESEKGLMPNVDFFSGLVYTALGIAPGDFTPIFAVSRITGWTAQILEQNANNRIYRPRAFYTGPLGKVVKK